jgi:hypothetical protein
MVDKIAEDLNITKPEDWYQVTNHDFINRGGRPILRHYQNSVTKGK